MVNFGGSCNHSLYYTSTSEPAPSALADDKRQLFTHFHKMLTSPPSSNWNHPLLEKLDLSQNRILAERVLQILYSQFILNRNQARTFNTKDRKARIEALNHILWKIKGSELADDDKEKEQEQFQGGDDEESKFFLHHIFKALQDDPVLRGFFLLIPKALTASRKRGIRGKKY